MKKLFFLTLLFLVPCVAFSQNDEGENIVVGEELSFMAPNYENIKRDISDPSSRFYYPRLLERLAKCDTTLNLEELRCIYYGYVHQPDFEPYGHFDEQQEIRGILFGDSEPSHFDFVKVRDLAEKVIAKKPTELPMYYYRLIGSYYTYGDSDPRTAARFFPELRYLYHLSLIQLPGTDITISGFRPGGLYADCYYFSGSFHSLKGCLYGGGESNGVFNQGVGRSNHHIGLGSHLCYLAAGVGNAGGCVAAFGLCKDVICRDIRQLFLHHRHIP